MKLRGRLLVAVLVTTGVVLAGLTAAFNIVLAHRLNGEATRVVQARATGELSALHVNHGQVAISDAPDQRTPDTLTWVFQSGSALEQPRLPTPLDKSAAGLARRAPAFEDVGATRLFAVPIADAGRSVGAVVTGVSLAPYRQSQRTALVGSVLLALAALTAVGIAAAWVITRALRPVAQMTRQAADWSEHDLDRRFSYGRPRDEITQLAFTLDGLLDRLAASLRHEQRLSAELSHELRTPLANLAAEAQYAVRHTSQTPDGHATLQRILESTRRMSATLDTLIAAARGKLDPHRATSDASACARAVAAACARVAAERTVHVTVAPPPEPLRVAVEQQLVERILAPVVENACRHATRTVRLTVDHDDSTVRFAVEDDGPGIADQDHETIFQPGRQLSAADRMRVTNDGAGLGLALSRRLARTAGGDVRAGGYSHGARLTIQLPAARNLTRPPVAQPANEARPSE